MKTKKQIEKYSIPYQKGYEEAREDVLKEIDDWFDGRGNMEKWEWVELKARIEEKNLVEEKDGNKRI